MSRINDLTICTVAYHSELFLEINWEYITKLNNKNDNWTWIIVDNTPHAEARELNIGDHRCFIEEGVPPVVNKGGKAHGSYHHAAGLNRALTFIKSRFVLFLDPDFYIIGNKEWINTITTHMLEKGLSFFGAPWHPHWYRKYRYFPCVHCLFVDLDQISLQNLDFTPQLQLDTKRWSKGDNRFAEPTKEKHEPSTSQLIARLQSKSAGIIQSDKSTNMEETGRRVTKGSKRFDEFIDNIKNMSLQKRRKRIGSSPDTGYRIFLKYSKTGGVKFECIVPVYKLRADSHIPQYAVSWYNRLLELLLPDRLCYIPRRQSYFTQTGFRESGILDLDSIGFEEFMWQGQPFGFHVRLQRQNLFEFEELRPMFTGILDSVISDGHSSKY